MVLRFRLQFRQLPKARQSFSIGRGAMQINCEAADPDGSVAVPLSAWGPGRVKTSKRKWPLELCSSAWQVAPTNRRVIAWLYLQYSTQAAVCVPSSVPMKLIPG